VATPAYTPADVEDGKVLAAIGYLWFLFFIPLVAKPKNGFCRVHARQAMVLFIAGALASTLSCFLHRLGGGLLGVLIFVLQIVALVYALQGKLWKIPGVWDVAERINL
jgi:uncharacterized membrane protein